MHVDIKPANVIIREVDFVPILIDFALAKNFNTAEADRNELTPFLGDWDLLPPLAEGHPLRVIKEANRGRRQDIFDLAFPHLDLFDFGKMLQRLTHELSSIFSPREISYLDDLINQLTNWDLVKEWSSEDLEDRISRLAPDRFSVFGIEELTASHAGQKTIPLPPGIAVPVTGRVEQLITNRSFRRLAQIHQLALLSLIYPGADYSRLVHVLYSYHLARELVMQLYTTPLFRLNFDEGASRRLLFTVLAHDINHFPFLHIFQEAEIPQFTEFKLFDFFCDGDRTGERALGEPSIYELLSAVGIDGPALERLVLKPHHEQTTPIDQVISSIINSGADIDKMSYLHLDGYFTGVRYGAGIDYAALFKAAVVVPLPNNGALHLAFAERGMEAVENVVMTRYWNFRSLYWHHTNRAIMAMLLNVIRSLYVEQGMDVKEYLGDTMWLSDVEALRYLDQRFYNRFHRNSILNELPQNRNRIYKRLYTVRDGGRDDADNELYERLRQTDYKKEKSIRQELAKELRDYLRDRGVDDIDESDILIDVPRRKMDTGGSVYMHGEVFGGTRQLQEVSRPIEAIKGRYQELAMRARLFISPKIARAFLKEKREMERVTIRKMIERAIDTVAGKSQVA